MKYLTDLKARVKKKNRGVLMLAPGSTSKSIVIKCKDVDYNVLSKGDEPGVRVAVDCLREGPPKLH